MDPEVTDFAFIPLEKGAHATRESGVCAMELVAWMAGEAHTDHPVCTCPVLATFVRRWNDGLPNNTERDRLLRPFLLQLIGTRSTPEVEKRRSYLALDWLIRTYTSEWLSLCESLKDHAKTLRNLPPIVDLASAKKARQCTHETARAAGVAARVAARVAAGVAGVAGVAGAAGAAAGVAGAAWAAEAAGAAGAAGAAAWAAAEAAIAPTVEKLQVSASDLLRRMIHLRA